MTLEDLSPVMRDTQILRDALARAIKHQGLSISETSRRAKVNRAALSEFLAGKCKLRSDVVDRLLGSLGLSVVDTEPVSLTVPRDAKQVAASTGSICSVIGAEAKTG